MLRRLCGAGVICAGLVWANVAHADVWFVEAEGFDEENSVLFANENGVNVTWTIVDDKQALGDQHMTMKGANRDACEACAPLYYPISHVREAGAYRLWARSIMPTTGSDSFFWQISNDGGKKFNLPVAAHGGAQWDDWEWKSWDGITLDRGSDNVLLIAERENNASLDIFCLRNDGLTPTDDEAEEWLEDNKILPFAIDPAHRLASTWGRLKDR